MSKIQRLPLHIANQIAAGEVVERPSSVVKELVENAIDAGATRIQVIASDGGRTLTIVDDGLGMPPDEAPIAFERFATSKIQDAEDLWKLTTMGFRGEALPSIASIAKVTCTTRRRGADSGVRVYLEGGAEPVVTPVGCPEGTTMRVEDLFFNTPARRKFLRADSTELSHVSETVTALALAHPGIHVSLRVNERNVFDTAGAFDLETTARLVLGGEIAGQLLPVSGESPHGTVQGLVSPPELIRSDRSKQWFFLNGRAVRHPMLARAVEEALMGHIPHGRHPLYILSLTVDPARVDVNVHPTKKEIRLADSQSFFILVREAVARALLKSPQPMPAFGAAPAFAPSIPAPGASTGAGFSGSPAFRGQAERPTVEQNRAAFDAYRPAFAPSAPTAAEPRPVYQVPLPAGAAPVVATGREDTFPWDKVKIIGQLHDTFIMLEHPDGLYLLDQHNSHERYLYEHMTPAEVTSQELLLPLTLALGPAEQEALADHLAPLGELGFVIEPFGEGTWAIRAVPGFLPMAEAEQTVRDLLGKAAEARFVSPANKEDKWRVTIACHSATRAGDRLTMEQMQRIVELWRKCDQPFTCPHGRPTGFLLGMNELQRRCLRS
ncbi:MAG TPA: DNA mismatch repair endonuclease MutL [Pantanalinema sp.]